MAKPKQLWWVEMHLSDKPKNYTRARAGVKGGKASSIGAAEDRRDAILAFDPNATVTIYGSGLIAWTELNS